MHWDEILGPDRAEALRVAILGALDEAYRENAQRHSPDDLGDNNLTFGVAVSQNLRFLVERAVEDISGLEVLRPKGSFTVQIDGRYQLHFYKAPPGVTDVRSLRFDASVTQQELLESNTEQLAWRFDDLPATSEDGEAVHLVVVHFGDPIEGLHRADVGAPLETPTDGLQWDWVECLSEPAEVIQQPWADAGVDVEEDDEDFGLRLRDPEEDQGMSMGDLSG